MSRGIYLLCLALGIVSFVLDVFDRTSPIAVTLVEWETAVGGPFYRFFLTFGFLLLLFREVPPLLHKPFGSRTDTRPSAILRPAQLNFPTPRIGRDRISAAGASPGSEGSGPDADRAWLDDALASATALVLDPHARVRASPTAPAPFTLHLRDATPEQVRRALTQFGVFLASVPVPRRVRIEFESCSLPDMARHVQVTGALRAALPDTPFHATTQEWGVEVIFSRPDPRWDHVSGR